MADQREVFPEPVPERTVRGWPDHPPAIDAADHLADCGHMPKLAWGYATASVLSV